VIFGQDLTKSDKPTVGKMADCSSWKTNSISRQRDRRGIESVSPGGKWVGGLNDAFYEQTGEQFAVGSHARALAGSPLGWCQIDARKLIDKGEARQRGRVRNVGRSTLYRALNS
jgi:hypothetical protein